MYGPASLNSVFGRGEVKNERMYILYVVWLYKRKEKQIRLDDYFSVEPRAHCFVISPIWTEMGGKESTNFMRSTILYHKMINISLTLSKYMNFLITYKNTKVKICIFPFSSFFNSNKGKIEFSHFLLLFLSYIQRNVFFSLSFLSPLPFLFSFLFRFTS